MAGKKKGSGLRRFVDDFFDQFKKKPVTREEFKRGEIFFNALKKRIIDEIMDDDVSKELINHTNPSAVLGISTGTLFGFLGFEYGADPMSGIIDVVEKTMKYKLRKNYGRPGYKMTVTVPTREDFRTKELILPWHGGYSVVDAIELGVDGLGFYAGNKGGELSRSLEGIQILNRIRNKEFRRQGWITNILNLTKELEKDFR